MSNANTKEINNLFEHYIDECRFVLCRRPETIRGLIESFKHFKNTMPELETVTDVSPELITLFFKRLQTRERTIGKQVRVGIKDSTVATYGKRLKTFFKWLRDKNYIEKNPFDTIKLPHPSYTDRRALKGEEIKKLMGSVAQYSPNAFLLKRNMAMIGIMTFCGIRRNELIGLEVRDIDIYGGFITIRGETSKSKDTRKIPINVQLRLYLNEYLAERKKRNCTSPSLLISDRLDHAFTKHGLKHWVGKIAKLSGVKFHVHRFRHTFATNLAMQDVGAFKIQKLMGHKDIKMTSAYLRSISTENMREDVNKISFDNIN